MRAFDKRLEKLEAWANPKKIRSWSRIIAEVGETVEEVLARGGFTAEDNVIVRRIVEPGGADSETGEAPADYRPGQVRHDRR